jgi:hypothetical protein
MVVSKFAATIRKDKIRNIKKSTVISRPAIALRFLCSSSVEATARSDHAHLSTSQPGKPKETFFLLFQLGHGLLQRLQLRFPLFKMKMKVKVE